MSNLTKVLQSIFAGSKGIVKSPSQTIKYPYPTTSELSITQKIEADQAPGSTQVVNIQTESPSIFFDLQLYEYKGAGNTEPVSTIKPGQKYYLRVVASRNRNLEVEAVAIHIVKAVELLIRTEEVQGSQVAILVIQEDCIVSLEEILDFEFEKEYSVTIPDKYPSGEVIFNLVLREAGQQNHQFLHAARLSVVVESDLKPEDLQFLEVLHVPANTPPPTNVVFLHVEGSEPGKFRLHAWNVKVRHLITDPLPLPAITLADFVEGQNANLFWLNTIHHFSENNSPELILWLKEIITSLEKAGEQCHVVIVDNLDSKIPWELLELSDNGYLGILTVVARWTTLQYYENIRSLQLEDTLHSGSMIAYINACDPRAAELECQSLDYLGPTFCQSTADLTHSFSDLATVGLVYLSYRGLFTVGDEPQVIIDTLYNPNNQFTSIQEVRTVRPSAKRPLLFVNAYHSGRILRDTSGSYGFAKATLNRVAAGYIGTIGAVPANYASRVAQSFLAAAANTQEGINPAVLLCNLRKEAADQLKADATNSEKWLRFLFTFMYVYYGNPSTRLRLVTPASGDMTT